MGTTSRELPSGIVTFVFTDIQGSTRLLIALGERFSAVIERHREILRGAWATHGGHEVFTEGDGSLVAFAEPVAALWACVEAQRGLVVEPWIGGAEVRVRMGVHTGLAAPYGGDYLALAVNHPTRPNNDSLVQLTAMGGGQYAGRVEPLIAANWKLSLQPEDGSWRIVGRLGVPGDGTARLD